MTKQVYGLKVTNEEVLKRLFKNRYRLYVDNTGRPLRRLINLLSNGNDPFQNKIRSAVKIILG